MIAMSRQVKRREAFEQAFKQMPNWETWTTTDRPIGDAEPKIRNHCKLIPRRIRRDMARQRSKRV